ncbi:uncharacterized protein BDR25DRAFT_261428 [Lindgomyces ingoldianus]|uniref:Uncharacterized protein n=1 Tax=Lindgomyces ingoldianus TaxID=673940 RepID=A0ACB6QVN4_9PLEO|nr:uncharacterized protein BDR25DRAFT_261428 [Lindgomyces ingoldianus]KAF2471063.1 hypothetical protein BDR25DRAFT_261428 [Lindgomyces ingoldianus]
MNTLPDEIILHIVSFLDPPQLVKLQHVSRQFLTLSRDNNLWKQLCFEHSIPEKRRRRHLAFSTDVDPRLEELIRAADTITGAFTAVHDPNAPGAELQAHRNAPKKRATLLANWDPTYAGEKVNFYQDFIQRHAPHSINWFQNARHGHHDDNPHHEATGAGILFDAAGMADKLIAPLEDGSVSIWDASGSQRRQGSIIARSAVGLLPNRGPDLDLDTRLRQCQAIMTETGAVECVSIDSRQQKGFFAVQNILNEVDLRTLQVIDRTPYPFPITALSEAHHPTPLTVGTNWTLHLHDTRKKTSFPAVSQTELIGGVTKNFSAHLQTGDFGGHVSLSQPGALSILHLPTTRDWDGNGDIWVGGRFTSFLNFDRRFFPRLRGTVHSGARLSCLTAIPHPFVPHDLRLGWPYSSLSLLREVKSIPGYTLIAAGEYKGKGSLELYSLSSEPARSIISSDSKMARNQHACYQNRQTASSSKLLSVAPHGTRLVFSDGDGNLKWVERDGSTPVRQFNINNDNRKSTQSPIQIGVESGWGDIVQKILPTVSTSPIGPTCQVPPGQDNLIIWTGDGKLGMVSFGCSPEFSIDDLDDAAKEEQVKETRAKERAYGAEMRRALEHQARELRWMRGYGL